MGDEPRRDGAVDRGVPGRPRRGERPGAEPITVEQLLARQGRAVGGRRAARRADELRLTAPADPPPVVRDGLLPVPGAPARRTVQPGLPPVPPSGLSHPSEPLPSGPMPARLFPSAPVPVADPDSRRSRRAAPSRRSPGGSPRPRPSDRAGAGRPGVRRQVPVVAGSCGP